MKRFLVTGLSVLIGVIGIMGLQAPLHSAYADASKDAVCAGVGSATGKSGCTSTGKSVNDIVKTMVNLLSAIVGIAAVIMIIVAGLNFITAGGDSSKISSARNTITYAIIGLIVVATAQIIVQFVIAKAS